MLNNVTCACIRTCSTPYVSSEQNYVSNSNGKWSPHGCFIHVHYVHAHCTCTVYRTFIGVDELY